MSESASSQEVALIHLKLAERYERLVTRQRSERPILHIVSRQPA